MIGFVIGFMVGVFSLICLILCQAQKPNPNTEEVYFALSIEIDGVKLYLNKDGTWGEFSPNNTEIAKTIKDLKVWPDTKIEKIGIRFVQSFK